MSTLTLKRRKTTTRHDKMTVGQYLLKRLVGMGLSHMFLTPNAQLQALERTIDEHPKISLVTSNSIESAAQMADGYAKSRGIGFVAFQELGGKLLDILMRSCMESVPLVILFGEQSNREFEKLYREFCVSWTELSDAHLAPKKIDRVLDYAFFFKKPVCIELPDEIVDCYIPQHTYHPMEFGVSDPDTLDEAILELSALLRKAKNPLIHLQRETLAHKAEKAVLEFAENWHIPVTSSHTARNFTIESHPNFCGSISEELAHRSDLVIIVGKEPIGIPHKGANVLIGDQSVAINQRLFPQLLLREVLDALLTIDPLKKHKIWQARTRPDSLLEDVFITTRDPELLENMTPYFTGDVIASEYASANYALASAIGVAKAYPLKRPIVLLDENDLKASLSELYIAHEECLPILICCAGNASWIKSLFPEIPVYRRRIPEKLPYELVIVSLE